MNQLNKDKIAPLVGIDEVGYATQSDIPTRIPTWRNASILKKNHIRDAESVKLRYNHNTLILIGVHNMLSIKVKFRHTRVSIVLFTIMFVICGIISTCILKQEQYKNNQVILGLSSKINICEMKNRELEYKISHINETDVVKQIGRDNGWAYRKDVVYVNTITGEQVLFLHSQNEKQDGNG